MMLDENRTEQTAIKRNITKHEADAYANCWASCPWSDQWWSQLWPRCCLWGWRHQQQSCLRCRSFCPRCCPPCQWWPCCQPYCLLWSLLQNPFWTLFCPEVEADPLVYTTQVHSPVVSPFLPTDATPAPRTILIAKILKIIMILKGLASCADKYGVVYEECVEYGEGYVECTQYVDCMATSSLLV